MAGKRNKITDIQASSVGWLRALAEEVNVSFPPDGEGWATMVQITEATGRDHQCVRRLLKQRNAEVRSFKTLTASGKSMVTPHYRLTDG